MRHSKKIRFRCALRWSCWPPRVTEIANNAAGNRGARVRVTDVTLGRAIGGDKAITDRTETFKPERHDLRLGRDRRIGAERDASRAVDVRGRPGRDESTHTIAPNNQERTEFHISKPDGWPAGKYKVEVFLDRPVGGDEEVRGAELRLSPRSLFTSRAARTIVTFLNPGGSD